jgi:hypothetical protein
MRPFMTLHVFSSSKGLVTVKTIVWSFSCMDPHMALEVLLPRETLTACAAEVVSLRQDALKKIAVL